MEQEKQSAALSRDPYQFARRTFFNRWKPYLLHAIDFDGSTRFSKFTRQLPITEKVLTANLKELEQDGLITRTVYPEVPVRVEYTLTELGKSVIPILDAIYDWGWHAMGERGLPIDPLGEMWHGYREKDEQFMTAPYRPRERD